MRWGRGEKRGISWKQKRFVHQQNALEGKTRGHVSARVPTSLISGGAVDKRAESQRDCSGESDIHI